MAPITLIYGVEVHPNDKLLSSIQVVGLLPFHVVVVRIVVYQLIILINYSLKRTHQRLKLRRVLIVLVVP
jgi:ABC-type uncharacterized transport system permease subunit